MNDTTVAQDDANRCCFSQFNRRIVLKFLNATAIGFGDFHAVEQLGEEIGRLFIWV